MGNFKFNSEQIDLLKKLKNYLDEEETIHWYKEENAAEIQTQGILRKDSFVKGVDLTSQELDELFSAMRNFSHNRNLSNLLYRNNGLKEFNTALRNLLHGSDSFPKRIDGFFKLKSIGEQTMSQFLVAFDAIKLPFVTWYTKELLQIDSVQEELAMSDAVQRFGIINKEDYLENTQEYLKDFIVFESIKDLLELEKYTQVNNLLWYGQEKQEGEEEPEFVKSFTSLSMEKDLRNFLADNLHKIDKDLIIIQKEFDAVGAGRIDLLCKNSKGETVVIELKKGRSSDEVVGQILRYMGWITKNQNSKVKGIIITNEPDEKLDYALLPLKEQIQIKYYRINFDISDKFMV